MAVSTKTTGWRVWNSLWLILAFIPMLNFAAFMYIGIKVENKQYKLMASIHAVLTVILFLGTAFQPMILMLQFVHYFLIVIQCVAKRSEYLTLLEQKENRSVLTAQLNRTPVVTKVVDMDTELEPETVSDEEPLGGKVNVNTCSEEDLLNLPGISVVDAKKAIAYRNQNGDYPSVEKFVAILGLKPHIAIGVVERITAKASEEHATVNKTVARQLDF